MIKSKEPPANGQILPSSRGFLGAPKGIRTPDPRIRSPLLYPAELLAHKMERVMGIEPT